MTQQTAFVLKKNATDPKWVIYRQPIEFDIVKKEFIPNLHLGEKGREMLANAKTFMSVAVNIYHWNELRDRLKEISNPAIISILDASGYVNVVLKKGRA
jgi:hypothetical protein